MKTDISMQKTVHPGKINQVGLKNIEIPLKIQWKGDVLTLPANIEAVVSLDEPHQRGIHMSRIYLSLYEFSKTKILSPETMESLTEEMISSQKGSSVEGFLKISWKSFLEKKSLKSSYRGLGSYQCFYECFGKNKNFLQGGEILYSSTCPCSAALSRELIQENFKKSNCKTKENLQTQLSPSQSHQASLSIAKTASTDVCLLATKTNVTS